MSLKDLAREITETQQRLERAEHRVAFLERVLRQIVMTHGGEVHVDVSLADAAKASTAQLWISGCEVKLFEENAQVSSGQRHC